MLRLLQPLLLSSVLLVSLFSSEVGSGGRGLPLVAGKLAGWPWTESFGASVSPVPETPGASCPKESNCFLDFTLLFPTLLLQGQLSSIQADVDFNLCYKLMFSLIYQYFPSGTNQVTGCWQRCQSESLFLTFFPSLGTLTFFFSSL